MFLDTFALVEYFMGTSKGLRVKEALKRERSYISIISIAEVADWCHENDLDAQKHVDVIRKLVDMVPLTEEICLGASRIKHEGRKLHIDFGLVDGLILATAKSMGQKVLTGDPHFRELPNVLML